MSEIDIPTTVLIDVWNKNTFGHRLRAELCESQALIEEYHREDARLEGLDRDGNLIERLKGNRHFNQFEALQLRVAEALASRQIRVWHYTRLLDFETATLTKAVELSTEKKMQERLSELKRRGHLTDQEIEMLLEGSALRTQKPIRENRFFCVPSPIGVTDRGVEPLLNNWGGEVVYFHQTDEVLQRKLGKLGLPRVIELAAKISDRTSLYSLSSCVLNTYALDLGFPLYPTNVDLCIKEDPPPLRVLAIHTLGEQNYQKLGRCYPSGAEILLSRYERWSKRLDD